MLVSVCILGLRKSKGRDLVCKRWFQPKSVQPCPHLLLTPQHGHQLLVAKSVFWKPDKGWSICQETNPKFVSLIILPPSFLSHHYVTRGCSKIKAQIRPATRRLHLLREELDNSQTSYRISGKCSEENKTWPYGKGELGRSGSPLGEGGI